MDGKIQYLNTDLDLVGPVDLTLLADALTGQQKLFALDTPWQGDDGLWYCRFEITADVDPDEPENTIRVMLGAVETLDASTAVLWHACTLREFNIGYDCGDEPWAFNQGLSNDTLRRIAACGGTLRWTLYPDKD